MANYGDSLAANSRPSRRQTGTLDVDPRDDEPTAKRYSALVITVGTSLSRLASQLRTLALILTGLSLSIWLSAAFLGRWFCRNALAPLTRMADSIATISADDLNQRVPSVDSGDELEELSRAFNQLLDRLQVSFERQRRFSAEASHQMRTPLTAMLGQLDVSMRAWRSADEYLQTLKSVREQTTNLAANHGNAAVFDSRRRSKPSRRNLNAWS